MYLLNKFPVSLRLCACCVLFATSRHEVAATPPTAEDFLMCSPGKVIFSETFTPGTVSERWVIRGHYKFD